MSEPCVKVTLSNGLQVMLKEIHTAPIISHWIWYRVGSRDEVTGTTGISHWVEHMQFKGTQKYPASVLDRAISREGGVWNAFTYIDWTTYFETMPADRIDLALDLEADRMVSSKFLKDEVESERNVIISEREGKENSPMFRLAEEVQAAAFRVHPYHHEVIGDMADLQTIQRSDLFNHYRAHYIPNNAVLVMAGDFECDPMLEKVKNHYSSIPPGPEPDRLVRPEPDQRGERFITVEGPGETTFMQVVYRAPKANHADFFPLTVLDSLLTGPSGLNMFGGGISNKTSRLYKNLVEQELAVSVVGGLQATIDPFLYTITLTVHPQRSPQELQTALDVEIQSSLENAPANHELERAVKQARALFAYGSESITNQAFWMGFSEMFSTYDWFINYLDQLVSVTSEDVLRVAQKYLIPQNRTIGVYLPTGNTQFSQSIPGQGEAQ